jgi:hypothetical protein
MRHPAVTKRSSACYAGFTSCRCGFALFQLTWSSNDENEDDLSGGHRQLELDGLP